MGEQLELTIESQCDKCGEWKPRAFSYFTERMWFCDDCRPPKTLTAIVAVADVVNANGNVYSKEALEKAVQEWNEQHGSDTFEIKGKYVLATIHDDSAWAKANEGKTVILRERQEDCEDITEFIYHRKFKGSKDEER